MKNMKMRLQKGKKNFQIRKEKREKGERVWKEEEKEERKYLERKRRGKCEAQKRVEKLNGEQRGGDG